MAKKIVGATVSYQKQPIYTLGSSSPIEFSQGTKKTTVMFDDGTSEDILGDIKDVLHMNLSELEPDSPLIHMSCDSIDDYELFVSKDNFIRQGYWYVGDTKTFSATLKEIGIAKQYDDIKYKAKNRLELTLE